MSNGKHRATAPKVRSWARRRRVMGATLALVLVGGIAWAAVLSRVGVAGNIGRGQFVAQWQSGATAYLYTLNTDGTIDTASATNLGSPTLASDRKSYTLPAPITAYPGEGALLGGAVGLASGTARSGYVSGLQTTGAVPAGWKIRLYSGCGALVSDGASPQLSIMFEPTADTGPDLDVTALGVSVVTTALPAGTSTAPAGVTCPALGS